MKYMGFQIVFKLKNPANWLAKHIFDYNLREEVLKKCFFGRIIKATFMHHLTPTEKHTLMDNFFFQNSYCWFILENFGSSLPNTTILSRDIANLLEHYGHGRHAWPHPRKISWSNCCFDGYLITCKKQNFYLK